MSALLQLLFLIISVKILGEAAERISIPSVIGEIFAGVLLGLIFHDIEKQILTFLAELGSIFLLFVAGYKEVSLSDLKSEPVAALIPTFFQIAFAFIVGFAFGRIFDFNFLESLFLGVAFMPTGIGVILSILINLNYLSTRPGKLMLSSAVLDDIIGLFFLSIVVTFAQFNRTPSFLETTLIAGKVLSFLLIMYIMGKYIFPELFAFAQKMHAREGVFSLVVIVALFSAYLAELLELRPAIGAFIGGISILKIPLARVQDIQNKVDGLAHGILIPLFFSFMGLLIDLSTLQNEISFTILIILVALSEKFIGGFVGSKAIGFDFYESLIFGIGIIPKAGVELVMLIIGRELRIINQEMFTAMMLMVVVSILISPACLKLAIQARDRAKNNQ